MIVTRSLLIHDYDEKVSHVVHVAFTSPANYERFMRAWFSSHPQRAEDGDFETFVRNKSQPLTAEQRAAFLAGV